MAGCNSELFRVDTLTIDGESIAIEDSSATIEGAMGFETEVVPASVGDDGTSRKRVPRVIKAKLLFMGGVTPDKFAQICEAQIVLTNLHTGKRVRAGKCRIKSMGEIGNGSVDIDFNCLSPFQWL
ncbi:hypothetical protein [Collimonas antrihumi]|uniref:hypothetical protein n=1 Tax=Collimonas antrihumi TaxID=1940615 RepID=UPI001B8D106C|nr:hypothetical protein [Collimonas antrihumi]